MIEIKAKELNAGEEFSYGEREFVALGWEQNGVLAVAKKPLKDRPFDEDGSNDWRSSSLREYLNGDFLENEFDASALLPFTSDLTADDGLKDYGQSVDLVFLLSADLYRKYRYQMPKWNTWVWLITPWSCLPSYGYIVRNVYTDGSLNNHDAIYGYGAAVACSFNPESSVICAGRRSKGEKISGEYLPAAQGGVKVKLNPGAKAPTRAHEADAGLDLYCPEGCGQLVEAKDSAVIDTGVCIEIPAGYVGFLKSKSGLNVKHGITSEGVIDSGYTGSIAVKLYNHSGKDYEIKAGDKISQLVILPIITPEVEIVDELAGSERGENGFGSSGR